MFPKGSKAKHGGGACGKSWWHRQWHSNPAGGVASRRERGSEVGVGVWQFEQWPWLEKWQVVAGCWCVDDWVGVEGRLMAREGCEKVGLALSM